MIKAIIVDLGGVYFENGTKLALPKIYKVVKSPKEKINEVFEARLRKEGWLYRLGKLTKEEFWKIAVDKLKIDKKLVPKIREIWYSSYRPIKGMKELVSELRKNYKVIAFSGNIRERVEYLNEKYNLYEDFDDFVLSFNVGYSKENIGFYKILLEKIKYKPEECIFVDDWRENLDIAKGLGMKTILFYTPEQLKFDLRKLDVKV